MNCPFCPTSPLLTTRPLDAGLTAETCSNCHGDWLRGEVYRAWREAAGKDLPEHTLTTAQIADMPVTESHKPGLCPECGALLLPYKVGHGLEFSLSRCGRCGGTWFEENEWAQLFAANLHDNLHQIFTAPWQHGVTHAEHAREQERILRARFGDTDYEKARAIRAWIDSHSEREALRAYLTNPTES